MPERSPCASLHPLVVHPSHTRRGRVILHTVVELLPLVESTSGVVEGDTIVWPTSKFARLFAGEETLAYEQVVFSTTLPEGAMAH